MIKNNNAYVAFRQNGFTLVEIMVGMVIGLLVTMVIVQVMSVFEGQKRATSGTADAQTNGAIALYNISREIQLAGYGVIPTGKDEPNSALKCSSVTARPAGSAAVGFNINPLTITNGTSDSITVRYGNSLLAGIPMKITTVLGRAISVGNNISCKSDDFVLITQGSTCSITKLAADADSPKGVVGDITLNLKSSETLPAEAVAGDSSIVCLGDWSTVTFAVSNANLQRAAQDSVAGIVNVQAQYGISATATSNQITSWVNPSGSTWATPSLANRNLIKAIRVAVVARNPKFEQAEVTKLCSAYNTASPTGLCAWAGTAVSPAPVVDLSADVNWKHYRYSVFETIVPLRNMIWNAGTL